MSITQTCYPMMEGTKVRIRRKPWARPELESCNFFIQNPCTYKGKWKELFGHNGPLYLELGCGKGAFVAVHGADNPDINYIALDIKDEVLVIAKRNIEKIYGESSRRLENIKLVAQEIGLIENMLGENDKVERIYINFCNPWPKQRHKKQRLIHSKQLDKYKIFLETGGEIWFKTDDDALFIESQAYIKKSGFDILYMSDDLHHSDFEGNVQTEHEKVFASRGIKVKFLIAKL